MECEDFASSLAEKKSRLSREGHGRDRLASNYRSFMFGKLPPPACPGLCLIVLSIHLRGPTDLRYFDLLGRYLRSADLIACLNIWDIWDLGDILEIYFAALNRNCSQNYEGNAGETYNADCGLRLNLSGTLARPFVSFVRPGVLGCCCLKDSPIFGRKFPVPCWNTGGYTIALV